MKLLTNLFRRKPRREWHPNDTLTEVLRRLRAAHPRVQLWWEGVSFQDVELLVTPAQDLGDPFRPAVPTVFLVHLYFSYTPPRATHRRIMSLSRAEWAYYRRQVIQEANPDLHVREILVTDAKVLFDRLHLVKAIEAPSWSPDEVMAAIEKGMADGNDPQVIQVH